MTTQSGKRLEDTIYSDALQEDVQLLIYLPPIYSELYKHHLLIAQDGRDYFNLGRIHRTADELLNNYEMENTIIVGIPYIDVQDRRSKYHPDGEKHDAYLRFLSRELVPYLDEKFPSYHMGMGRTLIGDSLGATVSLMAALKYPHTFGRVILQSPYVNDEVLDAVQQFKDVHLLEMYHVVGKKETDVETTNGQTKNFIEPNRKLHDMVKSKHIEHTYNEFDGDHTWTYWQPDLKNALLKIFGK